ncbi:MAG: phosphomannomutase/phosphoglucomutase [Myxococcota bacterium]|jgi:phosphomannomutase/phosphoglucomutase
MTTPPAHIWRTYDIRGRTPDEINPELALLLGRAMGHLMTSRGAKDIAVARDARIGGRQIQEALMRGLADAGMNVADIGMNPTPVMYFTVSALGFDAGIIVTASHNPAGYNGFKTRLGGDALFGEDIQEVRRMVEAGPPIADVPGEIRAVDVRPAYIKTIADDCRLPDRPLRVVVDAGNGVAGPMAVRLLSRLGVEVVPLFCDPDGTFPNHPANPTINKNLIDLRDAVLDTKADLGVGFDGDGDRIGAVSAKGEMFFGDRMLALLAAEILRSGPAAVVADVKCSMALEEVVAAGQGTYAMTQTGYPWIQKRMVELSAPLGGELSGHICFADRYYGFDDGLYAATRLLELVDGLDDKLAALPSYPAIPEQRLHTGEDGKWGVIETLKEKLSGYTLLTVDGIRFSNEHGWGLVRVSNTEPCLTVRAEARTAAALDEILGVMVDALTEIPVEIDLGPLTSARAAAQR